MTALCLGLVVFFAVVDTPANAQVIYGTIVAEPEGLADSQPVPIATRNALKGAMKHSIRLAQRSYRMAVPQFYRGRIQLLLSLYLRDSKRPDLALTLERHGGWYRAATILYTDWASRTLTGPTEQ